MKFIVFIGVTVWEILTFSARPYSNLTSCELLGALYNGVRLEQPVTCSLDLYSVLLNCECIPLMIICYKSLITGWLGDDTFRPSFSDLENAMKTFSIAPNQYIFTVVSINYNLIALLNLL